MEWIEGLNCSLDYIEENLDNEISYEKAAKIACCSVNHYQRMFSYISNTTLAEYIRRRRLTKAAYELQNSGISVIDVAAKYGYNSPTAFTRAFSNMHGVTPTEAKKKGTKLKSFPRISFKITVRGECELNYRIEEKGEFRIVGIRETIANDGKTNFERIPLMWQEARENGKIKELLANCSKNPGGMMGVCANLREESFDYYIAIPSNDKSQEGMLELIVKKGMWVIFECVGLSSIQPTWKRIFSEWFPSSGYECSGDAEIEWYPDVDSSPEYYVTEIWIPIVKSRTNGG